MIFYPTPISYICIYEFMYVVLADFGHGIILSLFLSYIPVFIPLIVPGRYIILGCKVQRVFCYSYAALGSVVHRLICCEVVSLYLSKSPPFSLFLFRF